MTDQQTPKSRARNIIKRYMETPGATLENCVFSEIVKEIELAEARGEAAGVERALTATRRFIEPAIETKIRDRLK